MEKLERFNELKKIGFRHLKTAERLEYSTLRDELGDTTPIEPLTPPVKVETDEEYALKLKIQTLENMVNRLTSLVEKGVPKVEDKKLEPLRKTTVPGTEEVVKAVQEVLGTEFDVEFGEKAPVACYQIKIVVPDKYDNRDNAQKVFYKKDYRSKVIPIIGGIPQIKQYATLVRMNIKQAYPDFRPQLVASF